MNEPQKFFKFTILKPKTYFGSGEYISLILDGPVLVMNISTASNNLELALRAAKAELKLEMVKAILNGEWEIEK